MSLESHEEIAVPPSSLKLGPRFQQARSKSRLNRLSGDWQQAAWDMPTRFHLWTDGQSVVTSIFSKKRGWSEGPQFAYDDTTTPKRLQEAVTDLLRSSKKGVGVIFHIADELFLVPVNEEELARMSGDLADVTLRDDPHQIVVEKLPEADHSWRLLKLHRNHQAMRLPAYRMRILNEILALRSRYPVRCAATAAPLQLLAIVPLYYTHPESVDPDALRVFVLYYPRFTCVAVIDGEGQLLEFANMPHSGKDFDPQFAQKLSTLIASCSRSTATVLVILVQGGGTSIEELHREIEEQNSSMQGELIIGRLTSSALRDAIETSLPTVNLPTQFAPEFLCDNVADIERVFRATPDPKPVAPDTLSNLTRAAHANFFTPDEIEGLAFPNSGEIAVTSATRGLWPVAWAILILLGAWGCWMAWAATSSPAWSMPEDRAIAAAARVESLRKVKKAYADWKKVLTPRSQAWSSMELLARLFPEDAGITITGLNLITDPEIEVKAGAAPEAQPRTAGVKRTFTIKGYTRSSNRPAVEGLNTAFVKKTFEETSKLAGAASFSPTVCEVQSRVETQRLDDDRIAFTLTIIQNFGADTEVALPLRATAIPANFAL